MLNRSLAARRNSPILRRAATPHIAASVNVVEVQRDPWNKFQGRAFCLVIADEDGEDNERAFVDERLPRDFVRLNVQAIENDIVVTNVLHQEDNLFETDGPGLNYVVIYSSRGQLLGCLGHRCCYKRSGWTFGYLTAVSTDLY
jgi:hypothetical protein